MDEIKLPTDYTKLSSSKKRKVREKYVELQDGKCWLCKNPLDKMPKEPYNTMPLNLSLFPKGFLNNPVHLHHNHNTNMTIGAVHAHCNGILWQYYGE